jgi:hypothetical protein
MYSLVFTGNIDGCQKSTLCQFMKENHCIFNELVFVFVCLEFAQATMVEAVADSYFQLAGSLRVVR